jgi:branched-chain amino acid transport system ATP-binding protein
MNLKPIESLLSVKNLSAGYAGSQVLFDVSMSIAQGEVVALLGRNGMGKSTFIRSLFGLTTYMGGTIHLGGQSIAEQASFKVARAGLGWVPEGRQIFSNLTVEENLMASFKKTSQINRVWRLNDIYELFPRLAERKTHFGNQLSGGEQQMLAIGRALLTQPSLLVLDEATEGLAPLIRREIWNTLLQLKGTELAVLIVDRDLKSLSKLADTFLVLEKGRIVHQGLGEELYTDKERIERYLSV